MQKKSKTILTAVVTALFVLSISYFALLAPTTAWYYQNEDKSFSFSFGNFSMSEPTLQAGEEEIDSVVLRGTTRFADAGEVLFDEMTHVIKVTASNGSSSVMSGSVGVKVKKGTTELNVDDGSAVDTRGLKWFVCEAPAGNATVKDAIDAMLTAKNSDWPIDYKIGDFSSYTGSTLEEKYEDYNADATAALKEYNQRGISVAPGETKNIYVVFWAEYGDLKDTFQVTSEAADRAMVTKEYKGPAVDGSDPVTYENLSIEIYAAPDTGGTQTQSLTVSTVSGASSAAVKLYTWNLGAWALYTGDYNNGSDQTAGSSGAISVPASGGSAVIADLPVGTPFKLVSQTATNKLTSSDAAVEFNDDGTVVTGTVSNAGNAVTVLAQSYTLRIANKLPSTGSSIDVKLYTWSSGAWTEYAGAYQSLASGSSTWNSANTASETNVLTVPADGAARIVSLASGTRYKLEITSAAAVHFNNSGNATEIIGSISGAVNDAEIIPNPS